jgi:hypothetical protein
LGMIAPQEVLALMQDIRAEHANLIGQRKRDRRRA